MPFLTVDLECNNSEKNAFGGRSLDVKNTNPHHGLTSEEMTPYVTRALANKGGWCLHSSGLLIKSRLEHQRYKTMERSILQLEALVDQWRLPEPGVGDRMQWFFAVGQCVDCAGSLLHLPVVHGTPCRFPR